MHLLRRRPVVAGARGTLYMRRRAEILASWSPCPDCNPGGWEEGTWFCGTCRGLGRVPPTTLPTTGMDGTHRRCAFDRCQAEGDILPGAPYVVEDEMDYHPGCLASQQWTRQCE